MAWYVIPAVLVVLLAFGVVWAACALAARADRMMEQCRRGEDWR